MSVYTDMLERFARTYGDKFDASGLDPRFVQFYGTGARIGVRYGTDEDGSIEYGTVSTTTGWRPCFLLMHRSSDRGSGTLLTSQMTILSVKHPGSRSYRPLRPSEARS